MRDGVKHFRIAPETPFDREDASEEAIRLVQAGDRPRGVVEVPKNGGRAAYLVLDLGAAQRSGLKIVGEFR